MYYFTSDLHFGHKNIIKYCNRPFETVEEMNEKLIENFNKTVRAKDTCYILGDVMMFDTKEAQECLNRLHGHLFLVRGNHDNMIKDNDPRFGWVKEYFTFRNDHEKFILCHYPFVTWNGSERGSYHLHGHQHNNLVYNIQQHMTGLRRFDVGVDANEYKPVSFEEIIEFFKQKPETEVIPVTCPYCGITPEILMDSKGNFYAKCMCQKIQLQANSFVGATLMYNEIIEKNKKVFSDVK